MKIINMNSFIKKMAQLAQEDNNEDIEINQNAPYWQLLDSQFGSISKISGEDRIKVKNMQGAMKTPGKTFYIDEIEKDVVLVNDGKMSQILTKEAFKWKI
jgi:hypothetical protein